MSENPNGQRMLVMRLETKQLIELLSDAQRAIGATITDEAIAAACGVSCRPGDKGYTYLQTAIRAVIRDHGMYWRRIPGAHAIKRLTPQEALDAVRRDREHIARTARHSVRKLQTIDRSELSAVEATELNASAAQLGTLAVFASGKTAKALEARKAESPVDLGRLLEAMK